MILGLTMLFAALVILSSCSDMKEDMGTDGQHVNYVLMKVTAPESPSPTRSADASGNEKVINSMRIYAFSRGQRVGYHYQKAPISQNFLMDIGITGVDQATGKQTVKFYIIVNEDVMVMEEDMPVLEPYTTEQQLNDLRFMAITQSGTVPMFYADTVMLNTVDTRPMSSLSPEVNIQGHESHTLLARKLSFVLKRPFGKLSFAAAKSSENTPDVYINEVSLLARGTRYYNYLMPQSLQTLAQIHPRPNDKPLLEDGQTVVVTKPRSEGYVQMAESYCFEVPYGSSSPLDWNVPNSDDSAVLKVVYSVGQGEILRTTFIYLPPICRNEWIQVACTISGEGHISVNYLVKDWEYDAPADGEDDFIVFDYPTHTYLLPSMPSADNPSPDPDPDDGGQKILPQMSVLEPFECWFQMLYPEGQTWNPTIFASDAQISDFKIEVYLDDVLVTGGNYPINEDGSYYKIRVVPQNAANVGRKVYLGITSEIMGFGQGEYLLINGSQSEPFWPLEGGTDPNALIITQIE